MTDTPHPEKTQGPIAWMAGHSVAANLLMLIFLVGGFFMLTTVKQEVFPDFAIDAVVISTAYPGASPEEVESGVLLAIEEAVRGLEDVDEVVSVASEGSGIVTVELLAGSDVQKATQDIQSEVDRITSFPEDAEEPEVRAASHTREVLDVVIHGEASPHVLHQIGERFRDHFLQDPGITQVELEGLPPLEIGIEISQENLRRYAITPEQVAERLRNASIDVPGGGLKTETGEILVRVKERRDYGRQFAQLPIITTPDGSQLLLGDIARIDDGFADTDRSSRFNGQPAVELEVYRVGEQTPIQVAEAVKRQLEELTPSLPPGISATIDHDRSEIYKERVTLLLKNGAFGLVLVLVLLGLFLEARVAFWVMMGIPISFLGSFLFLPATGVTINMISLFAYIISLGIVVDDAIVVGENIYHYRQDGMPFLHASVKGARQVAMPVTFSILTNIAAFMPIYFVPGVMGNVFKMIPIVVSLVFLISLGESLFVLPAHLAHQGAPHHQGLTGWLHERQQTFSRGFTHWVRERYGPFLLFALRHRSLTVAIALSMLMITLAYALSGRMGFQLFPVVESDFSQADVVLPYGAAVERTEAIMRRLEDAAQHILEESAHPELVESVATDIGRGGSHIGRTRVHLAEPDIRKKIMSTDEFTNRWREAVGEVAGVEYMRFASDVGGPGGRGRPITIELNHRDMDVLERASTELAETLRGYPRVKDVDDGFQPGKPQLDFAIKPEGKSLGLSAREVARQVRSAFYGAEVLRQQRGRDEIKVIVRLPETERSSEQTIEELMIRTPAGTYVPLREIATVGRGRAYKTIDRRNGRRVVQVSADVSPRSKAGEVIADLQMGALPELIKKYRGLIYTFEGHQAEMRESMGSLRVTFALALLVIYALLAIPFRSYSQPLIIMAGIPFGAIGAFLGHLLMGYDLCVPSMFGVVALSGVVVNDALVLIDFANHRRQEYGLSTRDAIHSAAIQRFRPVLLTTLTTFAGLSPMIFETSRQARFLIPMALSLGFGILFATLITLVLIPSLYMAVEDAKEAVAALRRRLFVDSRKPLRQQRRDK
jgi:multidrug efflux pump subunit AcrB